MDMIPYILIIDDRHSEVWFLERLLKNQGYDVATAFDGQEGLERIKEQLPDLIILDTIMPKMDGYTVYKQLLSKPGTARIPVLLLSDKGEAYERNKLDFINRKPTSFGSRTRQPEITIGTLIIIHKPIQPDSLVSCVQRLLQSANQPVLEIAPGKNRPRILIVDDDVALVQRVTTFLKDNGMDVFSAVNGLAGINKVKEEDPDLIILDTIMPQLNGLQVLQYLRQHHKIPVIMIPGQSEADLLSKALVTGAESFRVKPFELNDLLDLMKRKLNPQKTSVASTMSR